jgi:uncharacterized protein (TIGR02453 family)
MNYFSKNFLDFYKELAANNNRDWFQDHKKQYEQDVKKPMEAFIADLIAAMQKHEPHLNVTPSECIFRINRDIRFSKDKTPYKTYSSAAISAGGRKSMDNAGLYIEVGPEALKMGGGIYMPDKDGILNIREALTKEPKLFMKLLSEKKFAKLWGDLQGERNKIIPAEMKPAAEICPHIYNKQFFYWTELPAKHITSKDLMELVMEHYHDAKPVAEFLEKALKA